MIIIRSHIERDEHIDIGRALSLEGELLPPHHGNQQRRWRWWWRSMEMAPGAIPRPDRVPEQRLLSPESPLRWRQCCKSFRGFLPNVLGFLIREAFIGERGTSVAARVAH